MFVKFSQAVVSNKLHKENRHSPPFWRARPERANAQRRLPCFLNFITLPAQRQNDLDGKKALCSSEVRVPLYFCTMRRNLQLVLCRTVCLLFRRAQRADDVDHHKTLPHADQQIDDPAVRPGDLHSAFHGVSSALANNAYRSPGSKKPQAAAVCHSIQLDAPGLAQQALFGQHHVQHLVAGVAVRRRTGGPRARPPQGAPVVPLRAPACAGRSAPSAHGSCLLMICTFCRAI